MRNETTFPFDFSSQVGVMADTARSEGWWQDAVEAAQRAEKANTGPNFLPNFGLTPSVPVTTGWVCPVCHRGVAPTVTTCPCVPPTVTTWTTY